MSFFGPTARPNTGVDRSVVVTNTLTGASVSLGGRINRVGAKQEGERLKDEPIDNNGIVTNMMIPGGHAYTITVSRVNGDADRLFALVESTYYAGQGQVPFTITETTRNVNYDGSVDVFKYTQAVFDLSDEGEFQKKKITEQTLVFYCSQKLAS